LLTIQQAISDKRRSDSVSVPIIQLCLVFLLITMNRIRQLTDPLHGSYQTTQILQELPLPFSEGPQSGHASFVPLHYEPNYAYPLLVWLHGAGENERQLTSLVTGISVRNYVAVAPRDSAADRDVDKDTALPCGPWSQSPEDIVASEHRVLECIGQTRQRFNIASDRIFLMGSDCGGTMALRIAMMQPHMFAGVISIGGPFPRGHTPLACFKQTRDLQLLIEHGRQSLSYSETALCEDLRLLHVAGMSVTLRQYSCGDEITTQMLSDVNAWIMQQVTGVSPETDETNDYSSYKQN
jgi:phospholipase/carboxylesterase